MLWLIRLGNGYPVQHAIISPGVYNTLEGEILLRRVCF